MRTIVAVLVGAAWAAAPAAAQQAVSGELTSGDPRLAGGEHYHVYALQAAGGERVTIDLRSTELNTYLVLSSPSGRVLQNDDHDGSFEHSRIQTLLDEAGEYTVVVTSYAAGETGRYTLSASHETSNIALIRVEAVFHGKSTVSEAIGVEDGDALFHRGMARYAQGTQDGVEEAIAIWTDAVARFRASGDRAPEGATLSWIGAAHNSLGRGAEALNYFEEWLAISREIGDLPGEGVTLHWIGSVHESLGRPAEALGYYEEALAIQRELGDRPGEGATLNSIGTVHWNLGRFAEALRYYDEVLPIWREIGDRSNEGTTLNNIGAAHRVLGRPVEALGFYEEALAIQREVGDRPGEGVTLHWIGYVHESFGRPAEALGYYEEALAIRREVGDRHGEGTTLNNIGTVHSSLGRPAEALDYFEEALAIRREVGDRLGEGTTLHNIGRVHSSLGRPAEALGYDEEALAIRREVGDRRGEGATLNSIGAVHSSLGRSAEALGYYEEALAISRDVGDRSGEGTTLNNIGYAHSSLGRPAEALDYFEEALAVRREVGDRSGEGTTLSNIGYVHWFLDRPAEVLGYYEEALAISREVGSRYIEAWTLRNIAYLHRISDPPHRVLAVAYYDSAAAVNSQIAAEAGVDEHRLSFSEQQAARFQDWSLAWLDLAPEVGQRTATISALAATERGRAQALLDLMRKAAGDAGISLPGPGADLAAEGEALIAEVTRGGAAVLSYLVAGDTLISWLALPSGDVSVSLTPMVRDTLEQEVATFRRVLGVDAAAAASRLGTRSALLAEPEQDLNPLQPGLAAAWRQQSARLSALILPAALADQLPPGSELIILPHGPLALIPFAALELPDGGSLGLRYALRYAPSLRALAEAEAAPPPFDADGRALSLRQALVVGDPTMPADLDSLPGAKNEALWLGEKLGAVALVGPDAAATAVMARIASAPLVHLATHGYAYSTEARARESWIALAPDDAHSGLLTVAEILDDLPPLTADLVVLSACQTGLGDLKEAEGTVGLQRAFLARGARSVLVSLWNVSDEATEHLMQQFYLYWLGEDQPSKAEALRKAQEYVRGIPAFRHPRFWAPFQLVGAP